MRAWRTMHRYALESYPMVVLRGSSCQVCAAVRLLCNTWFSGAAVSSGASAATARECKATSLNALPLLEHMNGTTTATALTTAALKPELDLLCCT